MRLCRFQGGLAEVRIGLLTDDQTVMDLTRAGVDRMAPLLESPTLGDDLSAFAGQDLPRLPVSEVILLTPVEQQEVWAAGVTYLRSKNARMEESDFSASAYDRVYVASRPEIFFKSLPQKVVAPKGDVGIRKDSKWNVPEPELALVINSRGTVVGYTIGNDMSSRDIEGENLLYLPQAKTYYRSCAIGPWITVGESEEEARGWTITLSIERAGGAVFTGETSVSQIKRSFAELAEFLCRSQVFPVGAVLLTGTGIVPPDDFTLQPHDTVRIGISGIGTLENRVIEV
jgi:2-dehydro-3-deoxy-D-arabinonate dehydratase